MVEGSNSIVSCLLCAAGKYVESTGSDDENDCHLCEAGKYSVVLGSNSHATCQDCAAGKFSETRGNDEEEDCEPCAKGKYSPLIPSASNTSCISCVAGKYLDHVGSGNESSCLACSPGSYSSQESSSSCTVCTAGKYVSNFSCVDCPANSDSPAASFAPSQCACRPGYSGLHGNRSNCTACPPGFYGAGGPEICQACPAGSYNAAPAAGVCTVCPEHSSSSIEGSTSVSSCVCNSGFLGPSGGPCSVVSAPIIDEAPEFAETDIIVELVLGLPMSVDEFTADKQISFRQAIATAAGVVLAKVRIGKIIAVPARRSSRQLLAESISVQVEVAAKDSSAANAVASNLTPDKINAKLQEAGLPQAEILQAASVQSPTITVENSPQESNAGLIVGIVFAVLTVLAIAAALYVCIFRSKSVSKDDQFVHGYRATPYGEEEIYDDVPRGDGEQRFCVSVVFVQACGCLCPSTRGRITMYAGSLDHVLRPLRLGD